MTRPTPVWGDLRDFVGNTSERADWEAMVTLNEGRVLACQFTPMTAGATLVKFAKPAPDRPHVRRARRPRRDPIIPALLNHANA